MRAGERIGETGGERLRVGIVGAAGYTGGELVRLIHRHPRLELTYVAAKERAGQKLEDALPSTAGIAGLGERVLETFDPAKGAEMYEPWYGHRHATALSRKAVYGLPELHRAELAGATLIATPGCHVTAALLALSPLLTGGGLVDKDGIVIDTKTGVSGAGRALLASSQFSETAEGARPYRIA